MPRKYVITRDSLSSPKAEDLELKGGYQVLASTVDRDAIPSAFRKAGMLVYTVATDQTWILGPGITNGDWTLAKVNLTYGSPVNVTKTASSDGVSTSVARADHKHDISTAAPTTGIGSSNSEGTSTALARADHNHTLRTGSTDLTLGTISDGEYLLRSGTSIISGAIDTTPPDGSITTAKTDIYYSILLSDYTHSNTSAAQNFFPTGQAAVTVTSGIYEFDFLYTYVRTENANTPRFGWGGTATIADCAYLVTGRTSLISSTSTLDPSTVGVFSWVNLHRTVATQQDLQGGQTAGHLFYHIKGTLRVTAGGTLIPQTSWANTPTGTYTAKKGSRLILRKLGDVSNATLGSWA